MIQACAAFLIISFLTPWDRGRPARTTLAGQPLQELRAGRPRSQVDPNKFAVIINGAGGEPVYAKQFEQWTTELQTVLSDRFGFGGKNLIVLPRATAEQVKKIGRASCRERVEGEAG